MRRQDKVYPPNSRFLLSLDPPSLRVVTTKKWHVQGMKLAVSSAGLRKDRIPVNWPDSLSGVQSPSLQSGVFVGTYFVVEVP